MKDSTKRFYSLLASFSMAIGALVIYASLINPSINSIQNLRGERQTEEKTFNDYKEAIATTNNLIARSESLTAVQDAFLQSIPEKDDIPSLLNQIYGLSKINNILVSTIDFQSLPVETPASGSIIKPLGKVRATVKCIGSYSDIKNFTKAVETNVRLMDIYSVEVADGNKNAPTLAYIISVDAYYQPE